MSIEEMITRYLMPILAPVAALGLRLLGASGAVSWRSWGLMSGDARESIGAYEATVRAAIKHGSADINLVQTGFVSAVALSAVLYPILPALALILALILCGIAVALLLSYQKKPFPRRARTTYWPSFVLFCIADIVTISLILTRS